MLITCEAGKQLSESESVVIEYINQHQKSVPALSISELSELAFVSTATISRAVRKCGFESFTEMKFRLSQEMQESHTYTLNDILSKSYNECIRTIENISTESMLKIVDYLRSTKRVYLLALGLTSLVAEEFEFQLQCQHFSVCTISDAEIIHRLDKVVQSDDLVIILSVKNTSPDLYTGACLAKKSGAKLVVLCCKKGTILEEVADISVIGFSQPVRPNADFGSTSRLGLFIITRTIVEYLIADDTLPQQPGI